MPCECYYPEPSKRQKESVAVINFLWEVGLAGLPAGEFGREETVDEDTAKLCEFCKNNDVTKYSLELQIWWRDHQKMDQQKEERKLAKELEESERRDALAKLTEREKQLLGVD